ncbi:MAG: 50S ribosomal protein L22 [Deferribacterota bacterium]|nr:50S ribosomal protein L22 [Deferribacterota bacterium]
MEVAKAIIKRVRVSPRKARVVADMVRGRNVDDALRLLHFNRRKSSLFISKAIKSAVANAEENKSYRDIEKLYISVLKIDDGPVYKRFMPRAFGRASMIRKKTSHVTVILSEMED